MGVTPPVRQHMSRADARKVGPFLTDHDGLDPAGSEHFKDPPDTSRAEQGIKILLGRSAVARSDANVVRHALLDDLTELIFRVDAHAENGICTE